MVSPVRGRIQMIRVVRDASSESDVDSNTCRKIQAGMRDAHGETSKQRLELLPSES